MPTNEDELADLHRCHHAECAEGEMANGWGEVSYWPAERIEAGDWTPAIWRSPELAEAAFRFAAGAGLKTIGASGLSPADTGRMLRSSSYERAAYGEAGSFAILKSKGADGQTRIRSQPDEWWKLRRGVPGQRIPVLSKAGYLLITAGQRNNTARLTATADDAAYVGNGWMPVAGLLPEEAKGLAVFINSTAGRLQIMRSPGRTLQFSNYSVAEAANIRIPDIGNSRVRRILADCWERTKDMTVPQFRDGECEVRRLWDEAACDAMGLPADELTRARHLLHMEPHVRGLGYGQYADEPEDTEA